MATSFQMIRDEELKAIVKLVSAALDQLRIPYLIGGSVASSIRGIPRSTHDVDFVARVFPQQAEALAAALGSDFHADPPYMRRQMEAGRAFNVIQISTALKVDIFAAKDEFHLAQLERATMAPMAHIGDTAEYPFATAEDVILAKLHWYRIGGEVSTQQWNDLTDVIAVNPSLDRDYLDLWAARLGVAGLLEKAFAAVDL